MNTVNKEIYEAPQIEIIEVEVEKGFMLRNDEVGGGSDDIPLIP